MDIIAQSAIGISRFLHPDYTSAFASPKPEVNVEEVLNRFDLLFITYLVAGVIILGILLVHFISVGIKRSKNKR